MPGKTLLETAAGILSRRAHTEEELREKLTKKTGAAPEEIREVIGRLKKSGFLSDRVYTEDFVHVMRGRGYGDFRIREKLLLKGIKRELAEEVLAEYAGERDPFDDAMAFLARNERRLNAAEDPVKRTRRILSMLARRGFSPDAASRAASAWAAGHGK